MLQKFHLKYLFDRKFLVDYTVTKAELRNSKVLIIMKKTEKKHYQIPDTNLNDRFYVFNFRNILINTKEMYLFVREMK